MDDDLSEVKRIRVAWDRGINHLASFYAMLDNKRKEIGDGALRDYCFFELKISLSIIMQVSQILEDADRERVREELARVAEIDRENKRQEKLVAEERKHAERLAAATRKLERVKELNGVVEATKKVEKKLEKKPKVAAKGGRGRPRNPVVGGPQSDPQIITALAVVLDFAKSVANLRQKWVEASLVLAAKLYEGRNKYPADREFSNWLEVNQLKKLNKNDRAILIEMGASLEEAQQAFFSNPDSVSWRRIWGNRFPNAGKPDFPEENQEVEERPSIH
jgi:hypothetical protein